MEYAFHHAPFLVRRTPGSCLLELGHVILPLLLAWQGRESRHCAVPVEVERCLHNHEETCAHNVYFHFKDAHTAYSVENLAPRLAITVTTAILDYEFRTILEVKSLAIAFYRTIVDLYRISLCTIFSHSAIEKRLPVMEAFCYLFVVKQPSLLVIVVAGVSSLELVTCHCSLFLSVA